VGLGLHMHHRCHPRHILLSISSSAAACRPHMHMLCPGATSPSMLSTICTIITGTTLVDVHCSLLSPNQGKNHNPILLLISNYHSTTMPVFGKLVALCSTGSVYCRGVRGVRLPSYQEVAMYHPKLDCY
jgi:hypothetical protein